MAATLGNGNITFGDGTSMSTAGSMLGIGQTWQDVTVSRAAGTTYTNSTGKPIVFNVRVGSAFIGELYTAAVNLTVDGLTVGGLGTWQFSYVCFTAIVPDGSTYSAAITGNSILWTELR